MTTNRLPPSRGRSAVGRIQILIYRHQGVRWVAAVGAALAAFVVLSTSNDQSSQSAATDLGSSSPDPASRLPADTRGVLVPVRDSTLQAGDRVDVHAVLDGAVIASAALIASTGGEHAIVAVPAEQVNAVVDAVTTGGVVLVLVPR